MPGYAYPVGVSATEVGTSKSVNFLIDDSENAFFTASSKTKITSVLATNAYGSILPVKLYIYRDSTEETLLVSEIRVLKQKYMVQQLVSGDSRVNDKADQQIDRYKVATEFFLNADDALIASCPIEDVVTLTVTLKEGVN